ncbi:unnamed protein product [Linum trigynum]|uniref:Uncharacterized protein n=1 Tax=Linum trigynum TaxID=586398 RepID=A0AAV2DAQ7_9ROSI
MMRRQPPAVLVRHNNSGRLLRQQQVGRPSYDSVHHNKKLSTLISPSPDLVSHNHPVAAPPAQDKHTPDRDPTIAATAGDSVLSNLGVLVLDCSSATDERSLPVSVCPRCVDVHVNLKCSTAAEEEAWGSISITTSLSSSTSGTLHGWWWREEEKAFPPKKRRRSLDYFYLCSSSLIKIDDSYAEETSSGSSSTALFTTKKGGGERKRKMVTMSALLRRTSPAGGPV